MPWCQFSGTTQELKEKFIDELGKLTSCQLLLHRESRISHKFCNRSHWNPCVIKVWPRSKWSEKNNILLKAWLCLINWIFLLPGYFSGLCFLGQLIKPIVKKLPPVQQYYCHRWIDAWKYGSGGDYREWSSVIVEAALVLTIKINFLLVLINIVNNLHYIFELWLISNLALYILNLQVADCEV